MPFIGIGEGRAHVLIVGDYQPGDLPPEGFLEWHEWAEVQHKAGIVQVECAHCSKWQTPQELSGDTVVTHCTDSKGNQVDIESAVCTKCHNIRNDIEENI